jgi:hypothetical protein
MSSVSDYSLAIHLLAYLSVILTLVFVRMIGIIAAQASPCPDIQLRNGMIHFQGDEDRPLAVLRCTEFSELGRETFAFAGCPWHEELRDLLERAERFCIPDRVMKEVSAYADTEKYLSTHTIRLDHAAAIRESMGTSD